MAEGKEVGIAKPLDTSEIKSEAYKEFAEGLKNEIINFNAIQVDGKKIKEDTFYKLENGEFVEVEK